MSRRRALIGDNNGVMPSEGINAVAAQANMDVKANIPDLSTIYLPTNTQNNCKTIDIVCGSNEVALLSPNYSTSTTGLTSINLHGARAVVAQQGGGWTQKYGLNGFTKLETINAKLRCSYTTTNYAFRSCNSLANVEFQENAQTISINMNACPLSADSLISLANGLAVRETQQTLTLSSSRKTMCDSIMGTISSVTENDVTYDRFVPDENGTVSLTSFITVTKGWALA